MRHTSCIPIILLCLVLSACRPEGKSTLDTAWETVEKDPQQVIDLLDTCSFSRPSLRAQRAWLLSRAYDKCDVNIADDSLIMQAVKYYKRTHNQTMYLRSLYCLGRVQLNAGDSYNAMMSFEQTADLARKRKDWFWLGLSTRNISTIYNNSLWECEQKYLTLTKHEWESMNLCINNAFWEKLTDAQRKAIEKASAEASAFMRKTVQDSEADYLKKLADKGMKVIEVNIDEFRANMQYAYDKMVSTGAVTQEQVDKMMEIIKNARQ